jgi:hypothetical protein
MRRALEEERRMLDLEESRWISYEPHLERLRSLGPMQTRILSVLWKYSDPVKDGLPVTAVKAIVGGNRSNTRRAIRTLLLRGLLEKSEDGERIRLSSFAALSLDIKNFWQSSSDETLEDDERAMEILRTHGDATSP